MEAEIASKYTARKFKMCQMHAREMIVLSINKHRAQLGVAFPAGFPEHIFLAGRCGLSDIVI